MANIKDALRELAILIRDERKPAANTAKRVGSLLLSMVEADLSLEDLKELFLKRTELDIAQEIITFLKGLLIGKNGSGITVLPDGTSQAVIDRLYVKIKAVFDELDVKKKTYVGGEQIISPAGIKCIRVEELVDAYRCYFKAEEDGVVVENKFTVGTLAIAQECNVKVGVAHHEGNRYYWRAVTEVGSDFIDLSKTVCDTEKKSDVPVAGDDIVALGHWTDVTRQGAIVISSVNEVAPSIIMYQGINSFSLAGKDVIGFDYDKATGKAKMRVYGDSYIGARDKSSYIECTQEKGTDVKAVLHIQPGSTGWRNAEGLPEEIKAAMDAANNAQGAADEIAEQINTLEFGKVNMLRNSGFTGDYLSKQLSDDTDLNHTSEMYSPSLEHWDVVNVIAQNSSVSQSGKEAVLASGSMIQTLYYKVIAGENYIFSFRGKGTTLTFSCGGYSETVTLTSENERYVKKFKAESAGTTFSITAATCTLFEVQLERGTVVSAWGPSMVDNTSELAYYQNLQYIVSAIKEGSVDILGGLILASMLQLGNYKDGVMQKVTAGVSGVYNNGDDVAFWAGGTLEQAIKAVMLYKDNPEYQPSEAELATMANNVMTHGGRAILNDVIMRGYVYALGGLFKGTVDAANGKTHFDTDGTGWIGKLAEKYFAKWDDEGNGSLCFDNILWDNAKKLLTVIGKVEAKEGSKIGNLEVTSSGMMIGTNIIFENCASGYNWTWGPNSAEHMRTLLIDNIGKSSSFQLVFGTSGGTYPVLLPNYDEISNAAGRMVGGGFELKLFVPSKWGLTSSIENNSTFRITSQEHANLYNNNGGKMGYIDLSKGDFLELYGLVSIDPIEGTVAGLYCIDYYIKSLRQ